MAFFSYSLGPKFLQRPMSLALVRRAGSQQEVFRLSVSTFEGNSSFWTSFLCMPREKGTSLPPCTPTVISYLPSRSKSEVNFKSQTGALNLGAQTLGNPPSRLSKRYASHRLTDTAVRAARD